MFENDHSAARGKMAVRELIIFKHASELGNAASYKLFDAVTVKKVDGVASRANSPITPSPFPKTCPKASPANVFPKWTRVKTDF